MGLAVVGAAASVFITARDDNNIYVRKAAWKWDGAVFFRSTGFVTKQLDNGQSINTSNGVIYEEQEAMEHLYAADCD